MAMLNNQRLYIIMTIQTVSKWLLQCLWKSPSSEGIDHVGRWGGGEEQEQGTTDVG